MTEKVKKEDDKQTPNKLLYKNSLWLFFDYIIKIILISVLWFFFSTPFFYLGYVFIVGGLKIFTMYLWLLIIIMFSPFSFGAAYAVLQIVSQVVTAPKMEMFDKVYDKSEIKVKLFFNGIFKYFWKSFLLIIINIIISGFLYLNIYFYWHILVPKMQLLGLLLTGIMIWVTLIYSLMTVYFIPLLITKKINVFKAIYQSFLLVIDNVFFSISLALLNVSLTIILIFTLAGFFLIYYGIMIILMLLGYFVIYRKYDETIEISEEKRNFKSLIRPWSS